MAGALRACVLAAGKGTRMGGDRPKVLFEAAGKTLLEWVLGALSAAGVDEIVAVVGYRQDDVIARLPTGVRWAGQSPQLGTGHAVKCARPAFQDFAGDLLIACGDMPLVRPETYRELVEYRRREAAAGVVLSVPIPPESSFGRIVRGPRGEFERIVERKDATPAEAAIREGNGGIYCFSAPELFSALDEVGDRNAQREYYLTDVIGIMRSRGQKVAARLCADPAEALGVNTPEDLDRAAAALHARGA